MLIAALAIGLYGIERSLWLDEAWVANSVLEPSLSGMFNYPDWLQTTPPLFLLLVRGAVAIFGLSNFSLRIVPLGLALAAVAALMAAAWRVVSPEFAVLAGSLMAFHTTVIEYSHTLKQYSGEMAASSIILLVTVLYLKDPSSRRFWCLAAACALALPLAYATVFLLPGIAIAIGLRRASLLLLTSGVVLAILYAFFIRPNVSPVLRAFWMQSAQGLTRGLLAALLFGAAALAIVRSRLMFVALLPCFLLAATSALHWYPNSPRTRLFVLPGFFLAAVIVAEKLRFRDRRRIVLAIAAGFIVVTAWKQIRAHRDRPVEDFQGAVRFLRDHAMPSEVIFVHSSVKEGFKLYTRMEGPARGQVVYGNTGYPCCRRGPPAARATAGDVPAVRGRIWLFFSTRRAHWDYVGADESRVWRDALRARGCATGEVHELPDLEISRFDCPL